MYYTTTSASKPTAHITKNKSRLKIYNGNTVFLNDKDNFEFEIHNPTQNSVLCKIKLNGKYVFTSGLIIRPGQRVFLERFLDSNNKFEFSTYEVKDTSSNRDAIDLNGAVSIEFYDEQTFNQYPHLSGGNWNAGWTNINTGSPYYGDMTFTTSSSSANITMTSLNSNTNTFEGPNIRNLSNKVETGTTEKGGGSEQTFEHTNKTFNSFSFWNVAWQILPLSQKQYTAEEVGTNYCGNCGAKRKKSSFKFCPHCGSKF